MPVDTAAGLTDALRRCRLLEPAQLAALDALQAAFPVPRALAAELIRRGWLTPYQANKLLQDRGADLLLGSYVLLERLGEGGMGEVFKARNWKLGQVVALKLIRPARLDNADAVRRFQREIRAAAQLDHPQIVRALDADEVGGAHLLVMEYVEGSDLAKLVKKGGPLAVDKACDYARQAALGLQHASERGLVHRDIKPHNLLLTPNGVVKILDMGLARLDRRADDDASSTMTREGAVMGTLDYISPEQAMDSHEVDVRADLYSLGCTLYFLLTGKPPFPGGEALQKLLKHRLDEPVPVEQLRPDVPPRVAAVVRKLMAKRPQDRYQTPAEAAAALAAATQVEARPVTPVATAAVNATGDATAGWSPVVAAGKMDQTVAMAQRRRRTAPGRPGVWVGAAIGVVVLVLGLTGLFRFLPHGSNPPLPDAPPPRPGTRPVPATAPPAEISNSIGMKLKLLKPGTFRMGSPKEEEGRKQDEGPQHEVEITRAFYMGAYPVTRGQFAAFVKGDGYSTEAEKANDKETWRDLAFAAYNQTDNDPVVRVTWNDAVRFCQWLSKKEGKTYELPTEAEWEYACRAGTTTAFSFQDPKDMSDYAWYGDNSGKHTHPVGEKKPNPWGLYDMHGNVYQWCADGYDQYQEGSIKDPKGEESASGRVLRGGCWRWGPRVCRSACRNSNGPASRNNDYGFRVVMRPTADFGREEGGRRAVFEAWLKEVAALSADTQWRSVAAKLQELNPGFDGTVKPAIENDVVTGLEFLTDKVTDVSPLRALTGLKRLTCRGSDHGKGRLSDLAPLKGMALTSLDCKFTPVSDLAPLAGMPLTWLNCDNTGVADLSPLRDMKLAYLSFTGAPVGDLSPLKGMALERLYCHYTPVADLAPLKNMPLTDLFCSYTSVSDLSPLQGMPLTVLWCNHTQVIDLSPLKGAPLSSIQCDFVPARDARVLRSLKSLDKINGQPAADFWKAVGEEPSGP